MKKFAVYLPQFHEIPENNEWWGEGFTEWVSVKNAKALFEGHIQPKHPLGRNYYNLLEKKTVLWQTELAQTFGIDGFAYYHYYFNGKHLLEKPAENLLNWKEIDQKFFFIWANHPWKRTWEGKQTVLMPMEYGKETDWEMHFQYLLPFFKDDRYEKKDNMPLFGVFNSLIDCKNEMLGYLNKRAVQEGFSGIFFIESFDPGRLIPFPFDYYKQMLEMSCYTKAVQIRQPVFGTSETSSLIKKLKNRKNKSNYDEPEIYEGNSILENTMKLHIPKTKKDVIPVVMFEWDNTPRHKERGYIVTPLDKKHFNNYMDSIKDSEYILFNAWNEWAEGMILEPTEENGYRYLEWIKEWTENNESGTPYNT